MINGAAGNNRLERANLSVQPGIREQLSLKRWISKTQVRTGDESQGASVGVAWEPMPSRPQELPQRSLSSTQDGIFDLAEPLQEQKSNLFYSLISLTSVLLSSPPLPPPPPPFHPSISLSSQRSIAPWNAEPLDPTGRNEDQRSDKR